MVVVNSNKNSFFTRFSKMFLDPQFTFEMKHCCKILVRKHDTNFLHNSESISDRLSEMLWETFTKWLLQQGSNLNCWNSLCKHAINFLQKFGDNFEPFDRDVSSDLQKRVLATGVNRRVLELFNYLCHQFFFKIQNRFRIVCQKC